MAIVKQGGSNPYHGKVMTTMGYRDPRAPLCMQCGEYKNGQLYTVNGYGQAICADCAGPKNAPVLKGHCDPDDCACGRVTGDGESEPDPA